MGRLTTHVLDTAAGMPAAGLVIDLYRCDQTDRHLLLSVTTNGDGRCDAPLLEGTDFATGGTSWSFMRRPTCGPWEHHCPKCRFSMRL